MHDVIDEPLRLPPAPAPAVRPSIPVAAALVPVIGAVVLWQVTAWTFALWFAALGPLMAVAGFADGCTARRARRRAHREGAAVLVALAGEVEARHDIERARAWRRTPDVAGYASDTDEIWRVVPGRGDVVVVGRGLGPSAIRVEGATGFDAGDDGRHASAVRDLRRRAQRIDGVPVTVPFAAGIAVCGRLSHRRRSCALALQVCLAQPPGSVCDSSATRRAPWRCRTVRRRAASSSSSEQRISRSPKTPTFRSSASPRVLRRRPVAPLS